METRSNARVVIKVGQLLIKSGHVTEILPLQGFKNLLCLFLQNCKNSREH